MAEPGKEAVTPTQEPQDIGATDAPEDAPNDSTPPSTKPPAIQQSDTAVAGQPQATAAPGGLPTTPEQEAAMPLASQAPEVEGRNPLELRKPSPPPEATETNDARAATPEQIDLVSQAPPQELSDASGQPQQTVEAAGQPETPATAEPAATLPPPPEPPSQKAAPAAEAGKQLPAPPPPQVPGETSSVHRDEDSAPVQEGAENMPARRPWDRLRDAVRRQFNRSKTKSAAPPGDQSTQLPEDKGSETTKPSAPDSNKQPASLKEEKKPVPAKKKDSAGGVPADPAKEKDEDDAREAPAGKPHPPGRRKSLRRAESQAGAGAGGEPDVASHSVKKLQKAGKLVQCIMSWYNSHRSPRKDEPAGPATEEGKDVKTKPTTAPEEEKGSKTKAEPTSGQEKDKGDAQEAPLAEPAKMPHPPERRKSLRRAESQVGAVAGDDAGSERKTTRQCPPTPVKKLQKAGKQLLRILSWYNRHRSGQKGEPAAPVTEEGEDGGNTKPTKAPEEEKGSKTKTEPTSGQEMVILEPHPKWAEEEKRLENILEEAFTKLLATEYKAQLSSTKQKCLLTFSIFELASEVKKQSMIYWWVSQFRLPYRRSDMPNKPGKNSAPNSTEQSRRKATRDDAEGILSKLSDLGFLEPIKNYCCGVIHGCKVNPLVHWMVKRLARDDQFADLDADGKPTNSQTVSSILCLTAGYRFKLQKMRIAELQAPITRSTKGTQEPIQAGNEPVRTPSIKSPTEVAAKMDVKDEASMVKNKSKAMTEPSLPRQTEVGGTIQGPQNTNPKDLYSEEIKGKQVILNVDAHVYPLSNSLLKNISECLIVLQLGRWYHHDNDTYMEVDGLESEPLCAMNKLKNIRYLSLRGLSRLSKLPYGIQKLKSLEILDMRGCQNLVTVETKDISPLKHLTHLDLTECYMLERIGRGITSLTNLQVFKGFVFGSGTQGNKGCRPHDLRRLQKLQKLTISISTDANIKEGDMAQLKDISSLRSLTITWSEIPSILEDSEKVKDKLVKLLKTWTSFELPQKLEKLDLRCYPEEDLKLKNNKDLKKLYLRGGKVKTFSILEPNSIMTLRLRHLKNFKMEWNKIISSLKAIQYVEIRMKDEKLLKCPRINENDKKVLVEEIEEEHKILEKMKIPKFALDENGVWMRDNKEDENKSNEDAEIKNEAQGASEKSKVTGPSLGTSEVPSTKDTTAIQSDNKVFDEREKSETKIGDTSKTHADKEDQVHTQEELGSKQNKATDHISGLP